MASVIVKQVGRTAKEVDADTAGEVLTQLGLGKEYSVKIDGEVVDKDFDLDEDQVLYIARNEKGA